MYILWNDLALIDAEFAPNPRRYAPNSTLVGVLVANNCASSMHPGGLNVGFGDGLVKFIKDSISSWPDGGASNLYGALPSYYGWERTAFSDQNGVCTKPTSQEQVPEGWGLRPRSAATRT